MIGDGMGVNTVEATKASRGVLLALDTMPPFAEGRTPVRSFLITPTLRQAEAHFPAEFAFGQTRLQFFPAMAFSTSSIMSFGKIRIDTSSGACYFSHMSDSNGFKAALMEQIDKFDEERIQKQAQAIAGLLTQQ